MEAEVTGSQKQEFSRKRHFCRKDNGTDAQREAEMRALVILDTDHRENGCLTIFQSRCSSALHIPCESVVDTCHFCLLNTHLSLPQLWILV